MRYGERYAEMNRDALQAAYDSHLNEYRACQSAGLSLNMSRGKPHGDQLLLSNGLLDGLSRDDFTALDGTDCRNYGGLDGLPEMKRLFAEILEVPSESVIVGGNSSLNLMFDCIATLCLKEEHWHQARESGVLKFICPSPGYDRHFFICEYFNIHMIPVPMTPDGPDMEVVEAVAANDPAVVGMWCVPVFSNPQGYVYSDETIRRLAEMPAANKGFRLFWDNAYAVHHFRGPRRQPLNILRACGACGNENRPFLFTSFSKISFAGASVSAVAASESNRALLRKRLAVQTVGPDKINQLRHVRFFKDLAGVLAHMEKLAAMIRPKFERSDEILTQELAGTGAVSWRCPDGGYFLSADTLPGCAKRTVTLCRDAGVLLTDAGATFPYGNDPLDCNIRICPSFLPIDELEQALRIFCVSARLAALEKLLTGVESAGHA